MKVKYLNIIWTGHSGILLKGFENIYIDPLKLDEKPQDFELPKADVILITHEHYDHCSIKDINKIVKSPGEDKFKTIIFAPSGAISKLVSNIEHADVFLISAGEEKEVRGTKIIASEMYNTNKFRMENIPYHSKGEGVSYIVEMSETKVYHAGDTDIIPEMKDLSSDNIDVAFLPVGGKFTMDANEAAQAVKIINPKIAVPIHYGSIVGTIEDAQKFREAIPNFDVRILNKFE